MSPNCPRPDRQGQEGQEGQDLRRLRRHRRRRHHLPHRVRPEARCPKEGARRDQTVTLVVVMDLGRLPHLHHQ